MTMLKTILRQKLPHALVGSLGVALVGCAPSPFTGSYIERAENDLGELRARDRALLERAERLVPMAGANVDPLEAIDAEDFVQLALNQNPSLRAAQQRILRLEERIPQVTSLTDPMLLIAPAGEMAQTAAGQVSVMTGVSQKFPFPGKLDTRGRVAAQDVEIARQDYERVRLGVIADTRRSYWSLYYAVRAIEVTTQSRDLLSQLREVAQAKYRVGTATQEAVLRASVELNNLSNELITLEQRRATAAAMLNMLIDRPVNAPLADPTPIELVRFEARLEDLLASAEQSNPAIQAIRERIGRFREQRELARLNRYPDLTVSASYNLVNDSGLSGVSNGDDQWWFGFGINIPIWQDRLSAAEREATRGILETAGMLAGEQNRIAFRVQDAFVKVDTQQRQAVLLRDVIVPEAQQTVEASLSGYRGGDVDFLTLVDNWRKFLDFQLMYQANLAELERSFAELQESVGHDLARHGSAEDDPSTNPTNDPAANPEDGP